MKLTLVAFALMGTSSWSFASTIYLSFTGTIANSSLPGVAAGDTFSGTMTYETTGTVLSSGPASINCGFFQPQDGVVINVDGYTFAGSSYLNMAIPDAPYNSIPDTSADSLQGSTDSTFGSLFTSYPLLRLDETVANFTVNPLLVPSNTIPNPFNLADVYLPGTTNDPAQAFVQLDNGSTDFTFLGNIDTVTVEPEPPTLLFVGAALGSLVFLRHGGSGRDV